MTEIDLFATAGDALDASHFGLTEDGTPYVLASVFARALGYRDAANATRLLERDEVGTQIVSMNLSDGRRQKREVAVIYEDGIWELIFRSTLPSAKSLKVQVKRILRQLRETGVVSTREMTRLELIDLARESEVARLEAEQKLTIAAPKAEAYDHYMTADGGHLVREVTKAFRQEWPGLRVYELFNFLVAERLLFRRSAPICGQNMYDAKSEHVPKHFLVTATTVQHNKGALCAHTTVNVTPAGVELIRKRIARRNAA